MFKKLIIVGVIMFMMAMTAVAASVRPSFVVEQYGMTPVEWMAIIAGVCALISHVGRAIDKWRSDSKFKYDFAYLNTTILAISFMCTGILNMEVVELGLGSILTAISFGFTGEYGANKATKVRK